MDCGGGGGSFILVSPTLTCVCVGSGKTCGFISTLLPQLRCEGGVFVATSDRRDFEGSVPAGSVTFLPSTFKLAEKDLAALPSNSLVFYGMYNEK